MQRDQIVAALKALGTHLARRGIEGELYVVGGAAIAIAFDARRATRDVDAVFEPKQENYASADDVASELGLPPGEDDEDVRLLARHLGLTTADEVLAVAEDVYAIGSTPRLASSSKSCSRPTPPRPRPADAGSA